MSASGPSHFRASTGRNLRPRATGVLGTSVPGKEYAYPHLSLDSIALAPLVSICFESNPFPIVIHAQRLDQFFIRNQQGCEQLFFYCQFGWVFAQIKNIRCFVVNRIARGHSVVA